MKKFVVALLVLASMATSLILAPVHAASASEPVPQPINPPAPDYSAGPARIFTETVTPEDFPLRDDHFVYHGFHDADEADYPAVYLAAELGAINFGGDFRPEAIATREEYANLVQSLFGTDDLEPSSLIWLEKGLIESAQATTAEDITIVNTIYYDGVHLDGTSPDEPATPEFIVTTLFALFARGADFTTTAEYLSADADEWLHERKESLSPELFDKITNNETLTRAEMCELIVDLAEIS